MNNNSNWIWFYSIKRRFWGGWVWGRGISSTETEYQLSNNRNNQLYNNNSRNQLYNNNN